MKWWLVTYRDGVPARRQSPIQVLTGPGVERYYMRREKRLMTRLTVSTASRTELQQNLTGFVTAVQSKEDKLRNIVVYVHHRLPSVYCTTIHQPQYSEYTFVV